MTISPLGQRLVYFDGLSHPARFTDGDQLIAAIRSILRGWSIYDAPVGEHPRPVIRIVKTARGFRRVSPWLNKPSLSRGKIRKTLMTALCGFHFELIDWFMAENKDMLCLHCAAVQFGDGLVVFPTATRSGKSTLSVHLAANGMPLYCDDILPIEPVNNHGFALGILPRIRLPLPSRSSAQYRHFVAQHRGMYNRYYQYIDLPEHLLAPLGETAPIRRIVLLQRKSRTDAALEPLDKAQVLSEIIQQNYALKLPGTQILERLHQIVMDADCYRLRYSTGKQAITLLQEAFGDVKPFIAEKESMHG